LQGSENQKELNMKNPADTGNQEEENRNGEQEKY